MQIWKFLQDGELILIFLEFTTTSVEKNNAYIFLTSQKTGHHTWEEQFQGYPFLILGSVPLTVGSVISPHSHLSAPQSPHNDEVPRWGWSWEELLARVHSFIR